MRIIIIGKHLFLLLPSLSERLPLFPSSTVSALFWIWSYSVGPHSVRPTDIRWMFLSPPLRNSEVHSTQKDKDIDKSIETEKCADLPSTGSHTAARHPDLLDRLPLHRPCCRHREVPRSHQVLLSPGTFVKPGTFVTVYFCHWLHRPCSIQFLTIWFSMRGSESKNIQLSKVVNISVFPVIDFDPISNMETYSCFSYSRTPVEIRKWPFNSHVYQYFREVQLCPPLKD